MLELEVPSFPVSVTLPICGAALVFVLIEVWRLRDVCATFLLLSIWFRYSIATFHQYTYPPLLFGLSLIALTSVAVVAIGFFVIGYRNLFLKRLVPIYGIILVTLISAAVNHVWVGAINAIVKWFYLMIFSVAVYLAMRNRGSERILRALVVVFAAPILLQWISLPWGLSTKNEDGSISFIGGYQHQQSLSIILLTFLFVTCFSRSIGLVTAYGRLAISVVGLVLANYRTALLAAVLPAASLLISKLTKKVVPKQRGLVLVLMGTMTVFIFIGVASLAQNRFADIGTMLDKGASLVQPPQYFTMDEKRLFSGRAYLWSQYIDAYLAGKFINRFLGFGAESWVGRFPLYAHNSYISFLYELGIFGLAAFLWILISNLWLAIQTKSDGRLVLISCHIGFIILNMATMPIWTLEGDILYALVLGQTWYLRSVAMADSEITRSYAGLRQNAYKRLSEQR